MKKSIALLLGAGVILLLIVGGYILYVSQSKDRDATDQPNSDASSLIGEIKIQDIRVFKMADKPTQLNVSGQVQNTSNSTRSVNIRIVITRSDDSRQVYAVAVNSIPPHKMQHFGITKNGYSESVSDLQVTAEVVKVF